jgi:hypothetical protein
MKRSSSSRKTAKLSKSVHQQLNMYTLVAGAAGVGVLALAQLAEAKIVYTPANVVIGRANPSYNLDLNLDRITDFTLWFHYQIREFYFRDSLGVSGAASNAVVGGKGDAAALNRGAKIGPGQDFYGSGLMVREVCIKAYCRPFLGNWANVSNRYLGLKFMIKGRTHYGWARLSVQAQKVDMTATLTGYAYETIANKPIIAGKRKGSDEWGGEDFGPDASLTAPVPDATQPASLGVLALGAQGVPLWRRKESDSAVQGN